VGCFPAGHEHWRTESGKLSDTDRFAELTRFNSVRGFVSLKGFACKHFVCRGDGFPEGKADVEGKLGEGEARKPRREGSLPLAIRALCNA